MREIAASRDLVARCGLYCGACRAYLRERCDGCGKNERAGWCKVRACCVEKELSSCAACAEFPDARACPKFDNLAARLFGWVFRSDRAACVDQIRRLGLEGHASAMAERGLHTIRRGAAGG